jgi:hypothetical protein
MAPFLGTEARGTTHPGLSEENLKTQIFGDNWEEVIN